MKTLLAFLALLACVALSATRLHATSETNAVWLTRAYVTTAGQITLVPSLAPRLQSLGVTHLFVNTATLTAAGVSETQPAQLVAFLDALGQWEAANRHTFTVLLWVNATTEPAHARRLDVATAAVRDAVTAETVRYLDPAAPGSLVAGTTRPADGVMLEIQPVGGDGTVFAQVNLLLRQIKQAAGPSRKIGFAAHKIGQVGSWQLSATHYHTLARNVDYIAAQTYNSGKKSAADYEAWMQEQGLEILRAVSGAAWNNDAAHPDPTHGVKVFLGFPAFPADTRNHLAGVEHIAPAAAGTRAALAAADPLSRGYFAGAAVFAHSDGVSNNGYAKWDTDWREFQDAWLLR